MVFGPGKRFVLGINSADRDLNRNETILKSNMILGKFYEPGYELGYAPFRFSDLSSLDFSLTARINKLVDPAGGGDPNPNMNFSYNRIYFYIEKIEPEWIESPARRKFFYFIIPIYDKEYTIHPGIIKTDPLSGRLAYVQAQSTFTGTKSFNDMQWITIKKDLLPLIANAIQEAYARGYVDSNDLADYTISRVQLSQLEVSHPIDIEIEYKDYYLKAVYKDTGSDITPPIVSLTAPAGGATVSGTVTLSANASDPSTGSGQVSGVAGVQFKVDGTNVGAEDTTSPYSIAWNSTTVGNGTHTLRAVARDAAGNTRWSVIRSVTVSNTTTSVPRSVIHDPTYQSGFSVRTPESVLSYTTSNLYPFGNNNNSKPEWTVGQWGSQYPFSSTTPKTVLANGAVEYKTPGKRVVLGPGNYVLLGLNSIDWGSFVQRLKSSPVKGFISMVPEKHTKDLIPISQLESVQYKMSFRLVKAEQGGPGSGGAQAQANLRLTNRNPNSPGYGEWVYFIIKLYDNRYRTISYKTQRDGGTGALLYILPSSDFYGNKSAWDMQWITIDKDILPMFAGAIQVGYSQGYLKSNDLDDYVPTFTGVHWEMTALKSVEMEFKDYDMILTPKATAPGTPSCTLTATPASITAGNSSTLSWTTTNATTGTIDHSVGAMTPIASGSKSVSPTSSTLYTATVTGTGGQATCDTNVDVTTG